MIASFETYEQLTTRLMKSFSKPGESADQMYVNRAVARGFAGHQFSMMMLLFERGSYSPRLASNVCANSCGQSIMMTALNMAGRDGTPEERTEIAIALLQDIGAYVMRNIGGDNFTHQGAVKLQGSASA